MTAFDPLSGAMAAHFKPVPAGYYVVTEEGHVCLMLGWTFDTTNPDDPQLTPVVWHRSGTLVKSRRDDRPGGAYIITSGDYEVTGTPAQAATLANNIRMRVKAGESAA